MLLGDLQKINDENSLGTTGLSVHINISFVSRSPRHQIQVKCNSNSTKQKQKVTNILLQSDQ